MKEIIITEKDTYEFFFFFLSMLEYLSDQRYPGEYYDNEGKRHYYSSEELSMDFMSPCEAVITWKILTKEQRESLQTLYNMVLDYDVTKGKRKKSDQEVRCDPNWKNIQKCAKQILKELKNVKLVEG